MVVGQQAIAALVDCHSRSFKSAKTLNICRLIFSLVAFQPHDTTTT